MSKEPPTKERFFIVSSKAEPHRSILHFQGLVQRMQLLAMVPPEATSSDSHKMYRRRCDTSRFLKEQLLSCRESSSNLLLTAS